MNGPLDVIKLCMRFTKPILYLPHLSLEEPHKLLSKPLQLPNLNRNLCATKLIVNFLQTLLITGCELLTLRLGNPLLNLRLIDPRKSAADEILLKKNSVQLPPRLLNLNPINPSSSNRPDRRSSTDR